MVMWVLPALSAIGRLFGGASEGQAQNRINANDAISRNNQALIGRYGVQQGANLSAAQGQETGALNRAQLDLQRRGFQLNAPNVRGRQALIGDLMANYRPGRLTGMPPAVASRMGRMSGGLQMGDTARQFGALMARQALLQQMEGDKFKDVPATDFQSALVPPPGLQGPQGPGTLEQLFGWLSLGGNLAGLFQGEKDPLVNDAGKFGGG